MPEPPPPSPAISDAEAVRLQEQLRLHRVDSLKMEAVELKRMSSIGPALEKMREAKSLERKAPPASAASVGAAIDHAIARLERQTSWEKIEAVGQVELTAEDLGDKRLIDELAMLQAQAAADAAPAELPSAAGNTKKATAAACMDRPEECGLEKGKKKKKKK